MTNAIMAKGGLRVYVAVALASNVCFAQDWPQWRGPNRDGVVASFAAPKVWPDKLKTIWKVPVGIGHSSPVVAGRRVFIRGKMRTKLRLVLISTPGSSCGATAIRRRT